MLRGPLRGHLSMRVLEENPSTPMLSHDRGRLAEQDLFFIFGHRLAGLRIDLLDTRVSCNRCRAGADDFEPALHMREVIEILALPFMRNGPGIGRHVGDRIILSGDKWPIGEALVEDAIETVCLLHI